MQRIYGKPLDVTRLKQPVLRDLRESRLYEILIESLNPLQTAFDERRLSDGLICLARASGEDR